MSHFDRHAFHWAHGDVEDAGGHEGMVGNEGRGGGGAENGVRGVASAGVEVKRRAQEQREARVLRRIKGRGRENGCIAGA